MKVCSKCNIEKNKSDFFKDSYNKDGLCSQCKKCRSLYQKKYLSANKDRISKRFNKYYYKNRNKILKQKREYINNNKSKKKVYDTERLNSNAKYETYKNTLPPIEEIRRFENNKEILEVRCSHYLCSRWFTPTIRMVNNRISSINGAVTAENRFYCSDECKNNCSIFNQHKYRKEDKPYKGRPVQAEWRNLVLEKANYICEKCGRSDKPIIAHHMEGIEQNPIESADIDLGIALCRGCHDFIHSQKGCRRIDLRRCA